MADLGSILGGAIGGGIGLFGGPGTAALGASAGAAFGSQFGKKKKQGAEFSQYDPYSAQRRQLMDLLYQGTQQGVPGLEQYGQQQFQQLVPGIQEQYQAKRRLGAGSTPEIAALGRGAQGVATGVTGIQANARQNYARLLAGVLPQPTTAFEQPGPTGLQQLLSFAGPVASSYFQNQGQQELLKQILGGSEADRLGRDVYGIPVDAPTNAPGLPSQ